MMNRRQFLQASVAASTLPSITACGDGVSITIDTRLPVGPFGADSTAEEVTAGLDLNGKAVLITGCNSGVGYESMRVLALRGAQSMIAKTPEQGAATQVYVATAPALAGVTGAYFEDCNPVTIRGDNHVFDRELADRLWDETRRILGPEYLGVYPDSMTLTNEA